MKKTAIFFLAMAVAAAGTYGMSVGLRFLTLGHL
jgi:hypothetical protein